MRAAFLPAFFLLSLVLAGCGDEEKPRKVDHSEWGKLLARYVSDKGRVDYKTWREKDGKALDSYLDSLAKVEDEAKLEKNERLALWIDAYNAITVRAIVEFYPVKSIKEKVSTFGYNVWKDYKRKVAGRELSLDQIEHEILRKMEEPRIHFAIVCASIGCPVLRNEAYDGSKLDAQLEDQVKRLLADPTKFKVDAGKKVVSVSPIFDWFGGDFGKEKADRLAWLASHASDEATKTVLKDKDAKLEFLDWDWALNE